MSNSSGYGSTGATPISAGRVARGSCIVIGAGVAGLAAACRLASAGWSVQVLEARERVGGRLLTREVEGAGAPVELGAEFVHGRPPELLALLEEAKLAIYETAGMDWRGEAGVLRASTEQDAAGFALLDELEEDGEDRSFDEFLAESKADAEAMSQARRYVEGFNAADAARIGTRGLARQQAAEEETEGDRAFRLERGYGSLAEYLCRTAEAAGARLRLGSIVAEIAWQRDRVRVTTTRGDLYEADRVIVTLPLGVLQARSVRFEPEPRAALDAAARLAAGTVQRIVFCFRTPFWAARAGDVRFLFIDGDAELELRTWWTTSPHQSALLVGWMGGPRAAKVKTPQELVEPGLRSLEQIFALERGSLAHELRSWHSHDWQQDPYSLGAYSYAPKGGADAAAELARPVEGTLFFAGEHTDTTGHPGTVHGALRSGQRAAGQVLASR